MTKNRPDGRKFDELRKIEMEIGVIPNANGSARFKIGDTVAIAGVYGPKELHPRKFRRPGEGKLNCQYDLMSFSVTERKKPGPSRRDKELSLVSSNALSNLVFLNRFPTQVIDVFIEVPQADAGLPMKGLAGSISVGALSDMVVVDLTKEEEDWEQGATDMPLTYCPKTGLITHLQLDGEISKSNFFKALDMGVKANEEIVAKQEKLLKEKYKGGVVE